MTERINDFCCTGWCPKVEKVEPEPERCTCPEYEGEDVNCPIHGWEHDLEERDQATTALRHGG